MASAADDSKKAQVREGSASSSDGDRPRTDIVAEAPKRTWKSNLWDSWDKPPEERRFLAKLDAVVITFATLGYFIKYLDQVNVANAYVSGMKEDLGLQGNEYNMIIMFWTLGYVLGEIPSNMLLTKVRPGLWIPFCETVWSVLTILLAKCTNVQQIYVLRFFIGLAESAFYPGMQYIIGSWYRKDELAKRSCIFHAAGSIGTMFSGYLMAATYNLDTVHGYKGWQWLFIINTVISLPIALASFFFMPDVPEITKAWWLTEAEIELAKKRMALEGRATRGKYTKAKFKKIFSSWHIYALCALYIFFNNGAGYGGQPAFQLWLKSKGYSIAAVNSYPTIAAALAVVFTFIYAWTSDTVFKGARWPPMVFAGTVNIILFSSLAAWDVPDGWKWFCYLFGNISGGISGLTFAWAHEICSDDNEERALVTGAMNEMAYVFQAWLPLVVWQATDGPRYRKGFITVTVFGAALITTALTIRYLFAKEKAAKAKARESGGA
ncbi:pantothenate transporter liz1 [Microdochium bolleyi]|uniref:Pantothenate transporter liz1 n=1 Tax=Microdochium bolleyi TaxID=196109 RepID=A0A136JH33_9PEZI|nr:pantothenate transporter liz1 [Microdochium bolleyi]